MEARLKQIESLRGEINIFERGNELIHLKKKNEKESNSSAAEKRAQRRAASRKNLQKKEQKEENSKTNTIDLYKNQDEIYSKKEDTFVHSNVHSSPSQQTSQEARALQISKRIAKEQSKQEERLIGSLSCLFLGLVAPRLPKAWFILGFLFAAIITRLLASALFVFTHSKTIQDSVDFGPILQAFNKKSVMLWIGSFPSFMIIACDISLALWLFLLLSDLSTPILIPSIPTS